MPINTIRPGTRFLLAKADVADANGVVYPAKMLIEMAMRDNHLEMIGTELWYRDPYPQSPPDNQSYKILVIHAYDHYPTCLKCGHIHLFDKAKVRYDEGFDKLQKTCIVCGNSWWEELYPFRNKK